MPEKYPAFVFAHGLHRTQHGPGLPLQAGGSQVIGGGYNQGATGPQGFDDSGNPGLGFLAVLGGKHHGQFRSGIAGGVEFGLLHPQPGSGIGFEGLVDTEPGMAQPTDIVSKYGANQYHRISRSPQVRVVGQPLPKGTGAVVRHEYTGLTPFLEADPEGIEFSIQVGTLQTNGL